MTEHTKQRLQVNNAPDVHFEGSVIHDYTTQNTSQTKDRWTEIRLWETAGGAWVVESVGCSKRPGEGSLRDVLVVDRDAVALTGVAARVKVMDFLGWTQVAKAFARDAGWEMARRVP